MVYVTSESTDMVHVIDGKKNELLGVIEVSDSPRGVAVNEKTNTVYVTNQESNSVSVIDGSTNSVIDLIDVGEDPRRIVVNPESNIVYVANQGSNDVSVVDGTNNSVIDSIPVNSPFEMAINPDSNKVYVTFFATKEVTIIGKVESDPQKIILPPKKQVDFGISLEEIICKNNFELIFKSTDNSPVCVKPSTAQKLIERGWGNR